MSYGTCRICGCTDDNACYHPKLGHCWWVDDEHEVCSHCVGMGNDSEVIRPKNLKEFHRLTAFVIPGIKSIDEVIADAFETTVKLMHAKHRRRIGVEARQFAMWYRRKIDSKLSFAAIGNMYRGRDHATALHACKTVNNLMETNKIYRARAEKAIEILDKLKRD